MLSTPAALSISAAARYLSVSRSGLYRLINSGALTPAKVGGRTLIRRVDADAMLARAVDAPIAPPPVRKPAPVRHDIFS